MFSKLLLVFIADGANHKRAKPIHPLLLAESAKLRESDEVGRLMAATKHSNNRTAPLRKPQMQQQVQCLQCWLCRICPCSRLYAQITSFNSLPL